MDPGAWFIEDERGEPAGMWDIERDKTERERNEELLSAALLDAKRREREISSLLLASRSVLANRRFEDASRAIFDACRRLIGATSGYIALLTRDKAENEVVFLDAGGRACTVDPALPMPIRGLREIAIRTGKAVYENDFNHSEWAAYLPAGHVALDNVLFAPLVIDGDTEGLLGLAGKKGGFNGHDAEMAGAYAELASIALMNSRTMEQLQASEESLRHANVELDGYAHTVSHDLRSPLSAISLASRMLLDAVDDPAVEDIRAEVRESAEVLDRNIQKSFTLIEDLLSLAEAGQRPPEIEQVDVSEVVERVLAEHAGELEAKGFKVRVDEDLGLLSASQTQVYQVFSNLIDNALKHAESAEPLVEITRLRREDGGCRHYLVRDNGPGIPESDAADIFIPFFRRSRGPHYGIGLATVAKIVKVYGGEIKAFNDNGACFEFSLRDIS